MTSNKQKREALHTPIGVAVWPRLSGEPDTKFSKDGHGVWKTTLRLNKSDPECATFLEALIQRHKAAMVDNEQYQDYCESCKKSGKKPKALLAAEAPWRDEVDEEGNETGNVLVNFKMKASGVSKKNNKPWKRKPMLFDSKGQEITKDVNVGGGSKIRVAFEVLPFWTPAVGAGISLRMEGVQIIDLKTFAKKSAAELGFGAEEGYEFDSSPSEETAEPEADGEQTGPGDDAADFE